MKSGWLRPPNSADLSIKPTWIHSRNPAPKSGTPEHSSSMATKNFLFEKNSISTLIWPLQAWYQKEKSTKKWSILTNLSDLVKLVAIKLASRSSGEISKSDKINLILLRLLQVWQKQPFLKRGVTPRGVTPELFQPVSEQKLVVTTPHEYDSFWPIRSIL